MVDTILDSLVDVLKLLPFLFLAFLLIEYIEHKISTKSQKKIIEAGKYGPLVGGVLGAIPQCGFSVAATNLYAARVITLGTLIAIYLSTSDEMLPILLSSNISLTVVLKVVLTKMVLGIICGVIIDFFIRKYAKKQKSDDIEEHIHDICDEDHCDCEEEGILKSSIIHTLSVAFFILIITLFLNLVLYYLGSKSIAKLFMKGSIFSYFLSSLIGLIPNCGASVIITELLLNKALTFGAAMAGLLTNSGVGTLVLFRVNHNKKENIRILLIIYVIGVTLGILLDLFGGFIW